MQLRILYQNTMTSDKQSDRQAVDKRVDLILSATEKHCSTKFQTDKNNELRASLATDVAARDLVNFMGKKFSDLNTQFMREAAKFSPDRTASKMTARIGETETFITIEISTTDNESREPLQIPHQNP